MRSISHTKHFAIVATTTLIISLLYFDWALSKPLMFSNNTVNLERGASLNLMIQKLHDQGVLPDRYSLSLYARFKGVDRQLKAGDYQFKDGINQKQLLQKLTKGEDRLGLKLTVIEGWTFKQMRDYFSRSKRLRHDTINWSNQQIMASLDMPTEHPEGLFFPDTYHYHSGESDLTIFKKAHMLMDRNLEDIWEKRDREMTVALKNKYQLLILASIIEKEGQVLSEYSLIAGVFHNRLKLNMRLQADPTVIYGLGEEFDGNIRRKHLRQDNPYNTYQRIGLPPTPISLPSYAALQAAAHPAITAFLYFVARGDGLHEFSETLEQHNRAVNKYIRGKSG